MPFIVDEESGSRRHMCQRELRWSDFDQYQHVNNAKYLEFAQDAKMVFLKDVLMELDIAVPPFFVRHITVDYPHPLSPGEAEVNVATWVTNIGEKSCTMRQLMSDSVGRESCVVDTVMVGMDPLSGKSRPWSEDDVEHLKMFYFEPEPSEESEGASETRANRTAESAR